MTVFVKIKLNFIGLLLVMVMQFTWFIANLQAQDVLTKQVTINFSNTSIEMVLKHIQINYGVNFSYSKTLINVTEKISINQTDCLLKNVLDLIFQNQSVLFVQKANIIIIKPKPQNIDKTIIKGNICDEDGKPVEFAAIMFKQSGNGVITDTKGNFKIILNKWDFSDTLIISSMGFEKKFLIVENIKDKSFIKITMARKIINLTEIKIINKKYKNKTTGNDGFISLGSIYIDTHGQQTVLFVENEQNKTGKFSGISYYLSKNGNTKAPFRVRLYELDTITGKPGNDLLPEMIVAKPDGESGWFTVNLLEYNIQIPKHGFFAGIEGLYAGQNTDEFVQNEWNGSPETISYGQQLGYTRMKGKNTWHYSLANTWFQLEKNNYNVMISVNLKIEK